MIPKIVTCGIMATLGVLSCGVRGTMLPVSQKGVGLVAVAKVLLIGWWSYEAGVC